MTSSLIILIAIRGRGPGGRVKSALLTVMEEKPNFRDLLEALQDKAAKWMIIGINLDLSPDELDIIEADSNGVQECFTGVLRKWHSRTDPRPTWRAVIETLKKRAVGEPVLAKQLEERFAPEVPSGVPGPAGSMSIACVHTHTHTHTHTH